MRVLNKILCALLTLSPAIVAQADIVTFEDVPVWTTGKFQSGGYNFDLTGISSHIEQVHDCSPLCPSNGTHLVAANLGPSSLTMTKTGGGTFNLASFDGSGSFNFNLPPYNNQLAFPSTINVVGTLADGSKVTQLFTIDTSALQGPLPLVHYNFNSSFKDLSSVTFTAAGSPYDVYNGFTVDNILAVPEPGVWLLMLGGLGLMARRRAWLKRLG